MSQAHKAELTQTMIDEQLSFDWVPIFNEKGRIVKRSRNGNPEQGVEPKRFIVWDKSQDAPRGFGIAVNRTNMSYILQRRIGARVLKATLGNCRDIRLEKARQEALRVLEQMRETGLSPSEKREIEEADFRVADLTVEQCFGLYKTYLVNRTSKPAKDSTLRGVDQALRRLGRPEIALAGATVQSLATEDKILDAFATLANGTRKLPEGKRRANQHSTAYDRPTITTAELTFRWASRAVDYCMQKEARLAGNLKRPTSLAHNPFIVLRDEGRYRTKQQLEEHYEATGARNPMQIRDGSLGRFLDAVWERRKVSNNRTACDYLLLTLLWGTRRGEAAPLHWRDRISSEEAKICSWVDLKAGEVSFYDTKNRFTHTLPLAPAAIRVLRLRLEEMGKDVKWVFPARSSKAVQGHYLDSKAILQGIRASGDIEQLRTHDLRRTFATVAEEMATYAVVKRMLNHRDLRDNTGKYAKVDRERLLEEMARVERAMLSTSPVVAMALLPVATSG